MTILLHGALAAAQQFDPLFPHLPNPDQYFALNLHGYVGGHIDRPYSASKMARRVIDTMDQKQVEKATLWGYSMGGFIALYTAAHYPDRVEKVGVVNTKLEWNEAVAQRLCGMMNPDKIKNKAPELAEQLARWHAPENWEVVAENTVGFLTHLGQIGGLTDAEIAAITCPTLILRGENDAVVTAEECRHLQRRLLRARYEEIAESGHLWEQINLKLLTEKWLLF